MYTNKPKINFPVLVEDGSVSGICHKLYDEEHIEVVTKAMSRGAFVNPLNPEVFPGVAKMEAEVEYGY